MMLGSLLDRRVRRFHQTFSRGDQFTVDRGAMSGVEVLKPVVSTRRLQQSRLVHAPAAIM
jgi:hypothetical protein